MSHPPIRKAVIPAAGIGTRLLPATKSMPKEMLPIVDKPVLQFVVEEALASGIEDILIVTGRGKYAIENHFDAHPGLEALLAESGRSDLLDSVRDLGEQCRIHYIRQRQQLGLGDAVRLARWHVGREPFAVLLGDTIVDPAEGAAPGLQQILQVYERTGASVVAVQQVPRSLVGRYGVVDGEAEVDDPRVLRLRRLVEKPAPASAPSDLVIAARYVFTPEIFECIDETEPGVGGEIQLTDAMNRLAARQAVFAYQWQATRYDVGNRVDYARCFVDFALRREDIAPALRLHLIQALEKDG
jgi:UTP--glucose-1-phosphate uridylyltransferase